MREEILSELDRIEAAERVKILYAVESGSRAWGFESTDSDWDVRFLYIRPPEWYLSVQRRRDVLEFPISEGLDLSGWDLPKALGLFAKSNPPLLEWLGSPIVYKEAFSAAAKLRRLFQEFFSPRSCMHHYLHMGEGNFKEYLKGERVRVKKYFYVLRPVLACRWIETHDTMPPTEFDRLLETQLPNELRPIVAELVAWKKRGEELDDGPRIPELNEFLSREIERFNAQLVGDPPPREVNWERLDAIFRESLSEVWKRGVCG